MLNPEIMNELKSIREQEQKVGRIKMLQKGYKTMYGFTKLKTIRSFGNAIRNGIITMNMVNDE